MIIVKASNYFSVANQLRELKEIPEIVLHIRPNEDIENIESTIKKELFQKYIIQDLNHIEREII